MKLKTISSILILLSLVLSIMPISRSENPNLHYIEKYPTTTEGYDWVDPENVYTKGGEFAYTFTNYATQVYGGFNFNFSDNAIIEKVFMKTDLAWVISTIDGLYDYTTLKLYLIWYYKDITGYVPLVTETAESIILSVWLDGEQYIWEELIFNYRIFDVTQYTNQTFFLNDNENVNLGLFVEFSNEEAETFFYVDNVSIEVIYSEPLSETLDIIPLSILFSLLVSLSTFLIVLVLFKKR